jgi:hypothetical protein
MTSGSNEGTFYKITNKDIYCKLIDIEKHVIRTNGKVKLNRWVATTALTVSLFIMGYILQGGLL